METKEKRALVSYINMLKREVERTQRQAADAVSRMDAIYGTLEDMETEFEIEL